MNEKMSKITVILVLISIINSSHQLSLPSDSTYVAAVVEFDPRSSGQTSQQIFTDHAKQYVDLIKTNTGVNFDIIVFPEATLNDPDLSIEIPETKDQISPCTHTGYHQLLRDISCAAQQSRRYVVINLIIKKDCYKEKIENNDPRECSPDGWNLYNANVVFDRRGQVISTYRKYNLYEKYVNSTLTPDFGTFTTDFGVTFGTFICFDLMFKTPAVDLIKERGITNVVFPTMWFSELPFLSAVQAQQHWAYKMNVNFLAAGASAPSVGSTGSGIYAGRRGSTATIMSSIPQTRLLVAELQKNPRSPNVNSNEIVQIADTKQDTDHNPLVAIYHDEVLPIKMKQDHIHDYAFIRLTFNSAWQGTSFNLCQNGLCCYFYVEYRALKYSPDVINNTQQYSYAAVVSKSRRTFSGFGYGGVQLCALIACTNFNDYSTCGTQFPIGTKILNQFEFTSIGVKGKFTADNINTMPTTVTNILMPLNPVEYEFEEGPIVADSGINYQDIGMTLKRARNNLLTFGIYARDFAQDKDSSASAITSILSLVLISSVSVFATICQS